MDGTHLTYWLWVYRFAAVGIACIVSYFCGRVIGTAINTGERIYKLIRRLNMFNKPMQGNKKDRKRAREIRRKRSVSRFKKHG